MKLPMSTTVPEALTAPYFRRYGFFPLAMPCTAEQANLSPAVPITLLDLRCLMESLHGREGLR
jgi:hypothetical protein